jgi:hypothetical protein
MSDNPSEPNPAPLSWSEPTMPAGAEVPPTMPIPPGSPAPPTMPAPATAPSYPTPGYAPGYNTGGYNTGGYNAAPPYGGAQPGYGYGGPLYPNPGYGGPGYGASNPFDSRGTTTLVIGILGLVFCQIAAPIAWVMGNNVNKEATASGWPEPSNNKVGRILGIIGTVIMILIFGFFLLAFFGALASSNG